MAAHTATFGNGSGQAPVVATPPSAPSPGPPAPGRQAHSAVDPLLRVFCTLAFVAVAVGIALAPHLITESEAVTAVKVFAVAVAAFLPSYLFVRFLNVRATVLWDEYVLSLHRLEIDAPANLPPPPRHSIYQERYARVAEAGRREPTIYQEKFEAYFGKIVTEEMAWREPTSPKKRRAELRAQIGGLFPVLLVTAVAAVGWGALVTSDDFLSRPDGSVQNALTFGFLGAYSFILQMLLRRFFQSDLKASAYTSASVRFISVLALVGVLHWLWSEEFAPETRAALAFTVGFFPMVGMQALEKTAKTALRVVVPSMRTEYPLSDLDGLNIWYEARLLEEGIEDMQNLATANLVEVILHTRVPVGRLVDWIDQAHLFLHIEPPKRWFRKTGGDSRERLRRLGVRTATDLQIALRPSAEASDECRHWISEEQNEELREALRWALNKPEERGDKHPSVTQSILKTFENDPNLFHVKAWKRDWAADLPPECGLSRPGAEERVAHHPRGFVMFDAR